jgi:hypothetical protein
LSEKQARNLDILFKALPKSKEFEYRKIVFLKAPTELNPGRPRPARRCRRRRDRRRFRRCHRRRCHARPGAVTAAAPLPIQAARRPAPCRCRHRAVLPPRPAPIPAAPPGAVTAPRCSRFGPRP